MFLSLFFAFLFTSNIEIVGTVSPFVGISYGKTVDQYYHEYSVYGSYDNFFFSGTIGSNIYQMQKTFGNDSAKNAHKYNLPCGVLNSWNGVHVGYAFFSIQNETYSFIPIISFGIGQRLLDIIYKDKTKILGNTDNEYSIPGDEKEEIQINVKTSFLFNIKELGMYVDMNSSLEIQVGIHYNFSKKIEEKLEY